MDIVLGRGNANKALVRLLLPLVEKSGAMIASFEGGSLRNAIPREAFATLAIPASKISTARKIVSKHFSDMKAELAAQEPNLNIELNITKRPVRAIDPEIALKAVKAIYACPNGVERMSDAMPGLVETSNNLAIVKSGNGKIDVKSLMRSSVDSAKEVHAIALKSVFDLAGAKVSQQARTAVIEDYVFQKQTIQPDDVYAGFLQLELPKAIRSQSIPIEISIVAGVDTHRFFLFLDAPPTQEQTDTIRSIGARLVTANDQPESNDPKGAWRDRTRQYFVKWCIRNESKQMEALEHRNQDFEPFCQCLQGRIESVASSDEFKSTLNAKTDDERDALPYFFDVVDAFDNCQAQFNIPD